MPPKNFAGDDPLEVRNELQQFDQQVYGALPNIPDSGRIVAKLTSIYAWRADLRQPRRAIPADIRGEWDGTALQVSELFGTWISHAQRQIGAEIPMEKAVRGEWERPDISEPITVALVELIDLAASIYKDGLLNPMRGANGMIESGERRWLAYHLLSLFSGKDYTKIPTIEKSEVDVWAQAAENGSRTPLNAIGMARQIALLIMAMYEGDPGVKFDRFETLVLPGGSDRAFYAQVANGDIYRIKRGLGERVLNVTGLKTMERVRQFRALLSIPDMLWVKADVQGWSERQIRDYVDNTKANNPGVTQLHTVTGVTVSTDEPATVEGKAIPETERVRGVSGLYVDRPKPTSPPTGQASPPAPLRAERGEKQTAMVRAAYDEDFDDAEFDDEDEYMEPPQRITESTVAFARTWDAEGHKIAPVLELMRSLTDNREVKMRITELLTLAPSDVVRLLEGTRAGWWNQYIQESIALVEPVFREQIFNALNAYVAYIKQEGDYLSERYDRE